MSDHSSMHNDSRIKQNFLMLAEVAVAFAQIIALKFKFKSDLLRLSQVLVRSEKIIKIFQARKIWAKS